MEDRAKVSYSRNKTRRNTEMENFNSLFMTENCSPLVSHTPQDLERLVGILGMA